MVPLCPLWLQTTEDLPGRANRQIRLHLLQRRLDGSPQQFLGVDLWIAMAEHSVACHQNFCPGAYHFSHRVQRNAAVYLNAVIQPPRGAYLSQAADLMYGRGNELLPAKPGVY